AKGKRSTRPSSSRVQPLSAATGSAKVSSASKSWVPTSGCENSTASASDPSVWSGQTRTRPNPCTSARSATMASPLGVGIWPPSFRLQPAGSSVRNTSTRAPARSRSPTERLLLVIASPPSGVAGSIEAPAVPTTTHHGSKRGSAPLPLPATVGGGGRAGQRRVDASVGRGPARCSVAFAFAIDIAASGIGIGIGTCNTCNTFNDLGDPGAFSALVAIIVTVAVDDRTVHAFDRLQALALSQPDQGHALCVAADHRDLGGA